METNFNFSMCCFCFLKFHWNWSFRELIGAWVWIAGLNRPTCFLRSWNLAPRIFRTSFLPSHTKDKLNHGVCWFVWRSGKVISLLCCYCNVSHVSMSHVLYFNHALRSGIYPVYSHCNSNWIQDHHLPYATCLRKKYFKDRCVYMHDMCTYTQGPFHLWSE